MKNSPKGEIPWDFYFDFYQAGAIAGISTGTTIKYIDTQTNTYISISNILGFEPICTTSTPFGFVIFRTGSNTSICCINANGDRSTLKFDIRVFYFD